MKFCLKCSLPHEPFERRFILERAKGKYCQVCASQQQQSELLNDELQSKQCMDLYTTLLGTMNSETQEEEMCMVQNHLAMELVAAVSENASLQGEGVLQCEVGLAQTLRQQCFADGQWNSALACVRVYCVQLQSVHEDVGGGVSHTTSHVMNPTNSPTRQRVLLQLLLQCGGMMLESNLYKFTAGVAIPTFAESDRYSHVGGTDLLGGCGQMQAVPGMGVEMAAMEGIIGEEAMVPASCVELLVALSRQLVFDFGYHNDNHSDNHGENDNTHTEQSSLQWYSVDVWVSFWLCVGQLTSSHSGIVIQPSIYAISSVTQSSMETSTQTSMQTSTQTSTDTTPHKHPLSWLPIQTISRLVHLLHSTWSSSDAILRCVRPLQVLRLDRVLGVHSYHALSSAQRLLAILERLATSRQFSLQGDNSGGIIPSGVLPSCTADQLWLQTACIWPEKAPLLDFFLPSLSDTDRSVACQQQLAVYLRMLAVTPSVLQQNCSSTYAELSLSTWLHTQQVMGDLLRGCPRASPCPPEEYIQWVEALDAWASMASLTPKLLLLRQQMKSDGTTSVNSSVNSNATSSTSNTDAKTPSQDVCGQWATMMALVKMQLLVVCVSIAYGSAHGSTHGHSQLIPLGLRVQRHALEQTPDAATVVTGGVALTIADKSLRRLMHILDRICTATLQQRLGQQIVDVLAMQQSMEQNQEQDIEQSIEPLLSILDDQTVLLASLWQGKKLMYHIERSVVEGLSNLAQLENLCRSLTEGSSKPPVLRISIAKLKESCVLGKNALEMAAVTTQVAAVRVLLHLNKTLIHTYTQQHLVSRENVLAHQLFRVMGQDGLAPVRDGIKVTQVEDFFRIMTEVGKAGGNGNGVVSGSVNLTILEKLYSRAVLEPQHGIVQALHALAGEEIRAFSAAMLLLQELGQHLGKHLGKDVSNDKHVCSSYKHSQTSALEVFLSALRTGLPTLLREIQQCCELFMSSTHRTTTTRILRALILLPLVGRIMHCMGYIAACVTEKTHQDIVGSLVALLPLWKNSYIQATDEVLHKLSTQPPLGWDRVHLADVEMESQRDEATASFVTAQNGRHAVVFPNPLTAALVRGVQRLQHIYMEALLHSTATYTNAHQKGSFSNTSEIEDDVTSQQQHADQDLAVSSVSSVSTMSDKPSVLPLPPIPFPEGGVHTNEYTSGTVLLRMVQLAAEAHCWHILRALQPLLLACNAVQYHPTIHSQLLPMPEYTMEFGPMPIPGKVGVHACVWYRVVPFQLAQLKDVLEQHNVSTSDVSTDVSTNASSNASTIHSITHNIDVHALTAIANALHMLLRTPMPGVRALQPSLYDKIAAATTNSLTSLLWKSLRGMSDSQNPCFNPHRVAETITKHWDVLCKSQHAVDITCILLKCQSLSVQTMVSKSRFHDIWLAVAGTSTVVHTLPKQLAWQQKLVQELSEIVRKHNDLFLHALLNGQHGMDNVKEHVVCLALLRRGGQANPVLQAVFMKIQLDGMGDVYKDVHNNLHNNAHNNNVHNDMQMRDDNDTQHQDIQHQDTHHQDKQSVLIVISLALGLQGTATASSCERPFDLYEHRKPLLFEEAARVKRWSAELREALTTEAPGHTLEECMQSLPVGSSTNTSTTSATTSATSTTSTTTESAVDQAHVHQPDVQHADVQPHSISSNTLSDSFLSQTQWTPYFDGGKPVSEAPFEGVLGTNAQRAWPEVPPLQMLFQTPALSLYPLQAGSQCPLPSVGVNSSNASNSAGNSAGNNAGNNTHTDTTDLASRAVLATSVQPRLRGAQQAVWAMGQAWIHLARTIELQNGADSSAHLLSPLQTLLWVLQTSTNSLSLLQQTETAYTHLPVAERVVWKVSTHPFATNALKVLTDGVLGRVVDVSMDANMNANVHTDTTNTHLPTTQISHPLLSSLQPVQTGAILSLQVGLLQLHCVLQGAVGRRGVNNEKSASSSSSASSSAPSLATINNLLNTPSIKPQSPSQRALTIRLHAAAMEYFAVRIWMLGVQTKTTPLSHNTHAYHHVYANLAKHAFRVTTLHPGTFHLSLPPHTVTAIFFALAEVCNIHDVDLDSSVLENILTCMSDALLQRQPTLKERAALLFKAGMSVSLLLHQIRQKVTSVASLQQPMHLHQMHQITTYIHTAFSLLLQPCLSEKVLLDDYQESIQAYQGSLQLRVPDDVSSPEVFDEFEPLLVTYRSKKTIVVSEMHCLSVYDATVQALYTIVTFMRACQQKQEASDRMRFGTHNTSEFIEMDTSPDVQIDAIECFLGQQRTGGVQVGDSKSSLSHTMHVEKQGINQQMDDTNATLSKDRHIQEDDEENVDANVHDRPQSVEGTMNLSKANVSSQTSQVSHGSQTSPTLLPTKGTSLSRIPAVTPTVTPTTWILLCRMLAISSLQLRLLSPTKVGETAGKPSVKFHGVGGCGSNCVCCGSPSRSLEDLQKLCARVVCMQLQWMRAKGDVKGDAKEDQENSKKDQENSKDNSKGRSDDQ